jgi:hypothetical protein
MKRKKGSMASGRKKPKPVAPISAPPVADPISPPEEVDRLSALPDEMLLKIMERGGLRAYGPRRPASINVFIPPLTVEDRRTGPCLLTVS